jgi:hypothetical protein
MTMPNMTGHVLVNEILSIRIDMAIILCTGFSDQNDERKVKGQYETDYNEGYG